ncbi:MAG: DUF885 family protein [Pseudomonadales bacterium]|nr:DUF885 family protein [Pseudomonadales bacterium]
MEQLIFEKLVSQAVDEVRMHSDRPRILARHLKKINHSISPAMISDAQKDQLALLNWLSLRPRYTTGSALDKTQAQCSVESLEPEQLHRWLRIWSDDLTAARTTYPDSLRNEARKTIFEGIPGDRAAKHRAMSVLQDSLIHYIDLNVLHLPLHGLAELTLEQLNGNEPYLPLFRYNANAQSIQVNLTRQPLIHFVELEAAALFYGVPGQHLFHNLVKSNPVHRLTDCNVFAEAYAQYLLNLSGSDPIYQQNHAAISHQEFLLSRVSLALADLDLHVFNVDKSTVFDILVSHMLASKARIQYELEHLIRQPGQALVSAAIVKELMQFQAMSEQRTGENFSLTDYLNRLNEVISLPLPMIRQKMTAWSNDHAHEAD